MADGHGGYRKPSSPAPASGPGRLSRRTDGGPGQKIRDVSGGPYGDAQEMRSLQSGAAMSLAPGALTATPGGPSGGPPVPVVPFGSPTMQPGVPVTSGAALGAGPGPEALGLSSPDQDLRDDRKILAAYLPVLEYQANSPQALPSLRSLVRKIKAANDL